MKVTFIGATQTVTGSMHKISVNGTTFLLDCGLVQGKRKEAFEANRRFDLVDPKEIDFMILSHAHIDHAGNVPTLVARGFDGPIYSTFATKDLCSIMLQDSAHIQEREVEWVNRKRKKQRKNLFEQLYTHEDVYQTMKQFVGVNYHRKREVAPGVWLTFYDAGHILGSAIVFLTIKENGRIVNLAFSGDLGRYDMPILRDPETIPPIDYFIGESTYGGREHDDAHITEAKMAETLNRGYERGAKIVVPSFSVGRTQEIVLLIHSIFEKGLAPRFPIIVDSPLSTNATEVFRMHPECFDFETSMFLVDHKDPFGFGRLTYITDVEDSKKLADREGPFMTISASGMAETGRILHHLKNTVESDRNMVLMVGYCAPHTLGRRIIEREPKIKIFGDEYRLESEVVVFNSLSAHADSKEMLAYYDHFDRGRMQNIFLVHGDRDQQDAFKEKLHGAGFRDVEIPARGDEYDL
jgi:metallo-beta-lactamase family protein